jgi:single-stranded-DNA-specific exonuclease
VAKVHREYLMEALALAALGTVADVVPLRGENRILTACGLKQIRATSLVGLRALLEASGLASGELTAGDIGFKLAPRINAAGRLGRAELALELFLTSDPERAREIARTLDRENLRRRQIERDILLAARARLEEEYEPGHAGGIVLGDAEWHAGVIGIVASRLVDRFHRPVALVAFDGETGRGSCRSIPGLHLHEALTRCAAHLESFGGHEKAAGFSIRADRFEGFRRAFDEAVREALTPTDLVKRIRVDVSAPLSSIDAAVVRDVERLAPFGEGNPRPVFASRGVRVAGQVRRMGKEGQHLTFLAGDGRAAHRAIGWRRGRLAPTLEKASGTIDIAYTPGFDKWRADGSLELELLDVVVST